MCGREEIVEIEQDLVPVNCKKYNFCIVGFQLEFLCKWVWLNMESLTNHSQYSMERPGAWCQLEISIDWKVSKDILSIDVNSERQTNQPREYSASRVLHFFAHNKCLPTSNLVTQIGSSSIWQISWDQSSYDLEMIACHRWMVETKATPSAPLEPTTECSMPNDDEM